MFDLDIFLFRDASNFEQVVFWCSEGIFGRSFWQWLKKYSFHNFSVISLLDRLNF